jgi:hypothetical protein
VLLAVTTTSSPRCSLDVGRGRRFATGLLMGPDTVRSRSCVLGAWHPRDDHASGSGRSIGSSPLSHRDLPCLRWEASSRAEEVPCERSRHARTR